MGASKHLSTKTSAFTAVTDPDITVGVPWRPPPNSLSGEQASNERVSASGGRGHPKPIRAADRLDARTVELDIRARWHEAQAGHRWALRGDRIKKRNARSVASTKKNGASRTRLPIATRRRRVQLYRSWDEYVEKRRAEDHTEQWGLRHALSLIPVNRRYEMNSPLPRIVPLPRAAKPSQTGPLAMQVHHGRCTGNAQDAPNQQHPVHRHIAAVVAPAPDFRRYGIGYEKTLKENIANLLAFPRV